MVSSEAADFNAQVGNAVAAAWEKHRRLLFEGQRQVSEWLAEQIAPAPGATVLELTAGPGETGFLVAERVGPEGRVISTDYAPAMVEAAKRGVQARGLGNVECRVMDAQAIDLPDDSVDSVLSRFGVMLTPDPARVVREARRVLRPAGRFAYAVWGAPDRNPWLMLLVSAILERGHAPAGDPFGPGGVFSLADPQRNQALMEEAGFSDVRVDEAPGAMRYSSVDEYWDVQSSVSGPLAVLVASLTDDEVDAIRGALSQSAEPYRSGSGLELPSLAIGVTGIA